LRLASSRSRYLGLGSIAAAIFCPAAGFVDTSQVLITLIGVIAVTACASIFELFTRNSPDLAATQI
jgi:hypothetical protein